MYFVGVWLQLESRERANPPNAEISLLDGKKSVKTVSYDHVH